MGKGKHIGLGVAALAAGAGVAALAAGSHKNNGERAQKKAIEEKARAEYRNTERGRHEKNSRVSTIPTVITRLLRDRESRRVWMRRVPILSAADWPLWQQPASW